MARRRSADTAPIPAPPPAPKQAPPQQQKAAGGRGHHCRRSAGRDSGRDCYHATRRPSYRSRRKKISGFWKTASRRPITNAGPPDAPITMVVADGIQRTFLRMVLVSSRNTGQTRSFPISSRKIGSLSSRFDMKPRTEVDFTQNKDEVRQALYSLYFPGFSESNVFDALLDTVDRLKDVKGKKVHSGCWPAASTLSPSTHSIKP